MSLDFKSSILPSATPIKGSHEANDIERELKSVFLDLYRELAPKTFDVSVSGAAHLGSFDLVRRSVNEDGLVLLSGDREESATRYLYRAWKSSGAEKRGLHFLRTYLQLLFPEQTQVNQLWHIKNAPYGTAFITNGPRDPYWFNFLSEEGLKLDGSWKVGKPLSLSDSKPSHQIDEGDLFLTSKVEILLGLEAIASGYSLAGVTGERSPTRGLLDVIRSIIPARLTPEFRFWLRFVLEINARLSMKMLMQKHSDMRYPWCGRVLSEYKGAKWQLGKDGDIVKLSSGIQLGNFKLGERRGGKSNWKLKGCRIGSEVKAEIPAEAQVFAVPKVGQKGLRLDGSWALGKRQLNAIGELAMRKSSSMSHKADLETTFHEHIEMRVPATPTRLGRLAKLNPGLRLDSRWTVGGSSKKLGGFKIRRDEISTSQELGARLSSSAKAYAQVAHKTLQKDTIKKLKLRVRKIDGGWSLGSANRIGQFKLNGVRLRNRKMTEFNPLGSFKLSMNELSGLGFDDNGQVAKLPLNGGWKLGTSRANPEFSMTITRL